MRGTALAQHSSLSEVTQSEMGSRPHSPTEWKSWVPERVEEGVFCSSSFGSSMKS